MRIEIFSDLHLDYSELRPIVLGEDVEAVVVAGDTCEGAVEAFVHLRGFIPSTIPIIMVMGNHEYYRRFLHDELALAKARASDFNIHLLENDTVVLGRTRFVGATLWTDYLVFGTAMQQAVMSTCRQVMNDHRQISWQKKPWARFRPQEAALLHQQSRAYLEETLATSFAGQTVVITHHAPHWRSVDPKYQQDLSTGAYVSDLSAMIDAWQPTLWVHGHIHHSSDYPVGNTRVLCNPCGYGFENPELDLCLVVEAAS